MNALDLLARAALMGSNRQAPPQPDVAGEPGELLAAIATAQAGKPERALLQSAGVLSICAYAGFQPAPAAVAAFPPQPAESLPRADLEGLASLLATILESKHFRLKAEALAGLIRQDHLVPAALLPEALDMGRGHTELRPFLQPVLGERGVWLARLNPAFAWAAAGEGGEEDWENGSPAQRRAYLAQRRKTDPADARERLAAAFAGNGARERAELLATLAEGLGMADEDFLETCLGDRSREVKGVAAGLLARLGESRYAGRMAERLEACLTRAEGCWEIEAPSAFDAAWAKDGLQEQAPGGNAGQRGWWLRQLAAALPLSWWERRLDLTPEEIAAWAAGSRWHRNMGEAMVERLEAAPDPRWAKAFLAHPPPHLARNPTSLLRLLPEAERDGYWLALLEASPQEAGKLLLEMLQQEAAAPRDLAEPLARKALLLIFALPPEAQFQARQILPELVPMLPPSLLDGAGEACLRRAEQPESGAYRAAAELIGLRQELHRFLNRLGPES